MVDGGWRIESLQQIVTSVVFSFDTITHHPSVNNLRPGGSPELACAVSERPAPCQSLFLFSDGVLTLLFLLLGPFSILRLILPRYHCGFTFAVLLLARFIQSLVYTAFIGRDFLSAPPSSDPITANNASR